MKKVLIVLSTMLLALSCSKMADVSVVDLAKLTADYEARDGKMYWTALRVDEDGSTFTSSFEMTKLELK